MEDTANKVADALKHSWVYRLPQSVWPYAQLARWERPIGWWLLLWPCWWSVALVAASNGSAWNGLPNPWHLALFMAGAIAMRGAGCTYNDLVDIDIDQQVARTRSRPLPSGRVGRTQAIMFLAAQLLVGLAVLLQFNRYTALAGMVSVAVIVIYPFMKRITWWPQLFLGLAFSWGALLGWPASAGQLVWSPVLLYLGCIFWVIGYDTIYAHQDREDDALVGVHSTARLFGSKTRPALLVLYGLALVLFATAFVLAGVHWTAYLGLAGGGVHMAWQIRVLDIDNADQCLRLFKSNTLFGWIVFAGLCLAGFSAAQ